MNYEGKIEKCDIKKRSSSKLKKSMNQYKDYVEFKNKAPDAQNNGAYGNKFQGKFENGKMVQMLDENEAPKDNNAFDEMINEFFDNKEQNVFTFIKTLG